VNVHVPFGGLKGGSGYGKDLGEEGMEEWSVSKTVSSISSEAVTSHTDF
jgi:acyl-CoA reductase-like NAD-dependent aldehyde dehydrogenase